MKKKFALCILLIFVLGFCLIQCKQDRKDPWPTSNKSIEPLSVSASRATEIASSYADLNRNQEITGKNLRTSATTGTPRKVGNVRTLKVVRGRI